jgi:hypothetical protein
VSSVVPGPSLRALQQSYELLPEPRASLAQRRLPRMALNGRLTSATLKRTLSVRKLSGVSNVTEREIQPRGITATGELRLVWPRHPSLAVASGLFWSSVGVEQQLWLSWR